MAPRFWQTCFRGEFADLGENPSAHDVQAHAMSHADFGASSPCRIPPGVQRRRPAAAGRAGPPERIQVPSSIPRAITRSTCIAPSVHLSSSFAADRAGGDVTFALARFSTGIYSCMPRMAGALHAARYTRPWAAPHALRNRRENRLATAVSSAPLRSCTLQECNAAAAGPPERIQGYFPFTRFTSPHCLIHATMDYVRCRHGNQGTLNGGH